AIELHVTAVTVAELGYGVARLPEGARRDALAAAVDAMLDVDIDRRVLPFDHAAAEIYGAIVVGGRAERPADQPGGCADRRRLCSTRRHPRHAQRSRLHRHRHRGRRSLAGGLTPGAAS